MTATATFGEFEDGKAYTAEAIAKKWGRSIKETRAILLDNFHVTDLGGGFLLVSGLSLRLDVERMSQSPGVQGDDGDLPAEPHRRRRSKPKPKPEDSEPEDEPKPRPPKRRRKPPSE